MLLSALPTLASATLAPLMPHELVPFSLVLTRQRPHALAEAVASVSDPESSHFRRYMDDAAVAQLLQPTDLGAVESWVRRGAPSARVQRRAHGSGQVLSVEAPAAEVSMLLGVQLRRVGRLVRAVPGSAAPPLPASVEPHVETVLGIYDPGRSPTTRPTSAQAGPAVEQPGDTGPSAVAQQQRDCQFKGDIIDPDVLAKQYGWPTPSGKSATGKVSQGVAAFEDAEFKPSDVAAFEVAYQLPNVSFAVSGPNDGGYFGEASLDTQYIAASGAGVPSWFVSQEAFDLASWCETALAVQPLPTVWSISWGGGESNYPVADQRAADACFARAALKGVTVLAASGDDGTGAKPGPLGFGCKAFDPTYPASLPSVTAVGATYLEDAEEGGWSFSGGGYSALWARPAWQAVAVGAYEASGATLPDTSLYNASGRVTPDVAALGTCFRVFSGGGAAGTLSGTSAATPTFAGMVSRINDRLAARGKPPVGFINPLLYRAGDVGTDIVDGNNKKKACAAGFPATKGFDAVTGLGTPLWSKLSDVLEAGRYEGMEDVRYY